MAIIQILIAKGVKINIQYGLVRISNHMWIRSILD